MTAAARPAVTGAVWRPGLGGSHGQGHVWTRPPGRGRRGRRPGRGGGTVAEAGPGCAALVGRGVTSQLRLVTARDSVGVPAYGESDTVTGRRTGGTGLQVIPVSHHSQYVTVPVTRDSV